MTGEAPPHERLARQLVEGRVRDVRRDERGLARAVDLRGRAAPRAVAAAVVPRQAQEVRRQQALELGRRRRRPVAQAHQQEALLRALPGDLRRRVSASSGARLAAEPGDVRVVVDVEHVAEARRYKDDGATLAELREAVNTLEETDRTARRVLGGAHPITGGIEDELQDARDALYARGLP